jgi:heme a synthase
MGMDYFCCMTDLKLNSANRAVAIWVLAGTIMLCIQVLLGGITRLTGSGLSITEWNVITGTIPPLNGQQWMEEFNKYRQTPQFQILNTDFNLSDFKFIFFWEWFHRLWARLVGVVFLVGFALLLYKKKLKSEMIIPLLVLFFLGLLQAAVGWIMVASGLTGDAIYVKPTRLALHFIFAIVLISYAFWYSLNLLIPAERTNRVKGKWSTAILLVILVFFQLLYGALMAGNKAAAVAPGWPMINGDWIPGNLFRESPFPVNFVGNKLMIHFIHRNLAYLILAGIIVWTINILKSEKDPDRRRRLLYPLVLVLIQILLGIGALISSPGIIANRWVAFDCIALLHQLNAMLLLFSLIYAIYLLRPVKK